MGVCVKCQQPSDHHVCEACDAAEDLVADALIDDAVPVTLREAQLLRHARGLGLCAMPGTETEALLVGLWNRGLLVRDDEAPYTYRAADDVARALDADVEESDGD